MEEGDVVFTAGRLLYAEKPPLGKSGCETSAVVGKDILMTFPSQVSFPDSNPTTIDFTE